MASNKIYAISDLHVDYEENMKWIEQLSDQNYRNDTIIIAGDVTHVPSKLIRTLKLFKEKFQDVYFCPGNHELWTVGQREDQELGIQNSIEKFHYIIKICDQLGVHTKPRVTPQNILIVPLFGWYDESLHILSENVISDYGLWTDTYQCKWPDDALHSTPAKYFTKLNDEYISNLSEEIKNSKMIITFSHFLTSKKLMIAYINEMKERSKKRQPTTTINPVRYPNFSLVAGTELLNEQLERIKPQVHIFGHSHRKMTLDIGDGIRYINNPLGYVRERQLGLIESPHELFEI